MRELSLVDKMHMRRVCKNLVQYIKDVHVLNTYKYNFECLGSNIPEDILDGAKANIRRTRRECFDRYHAEELSAYPPMLQHPGLVEAEKKPKRVKQQKSTVQSSEAAGKRVRTKNFKTVIGMMKRQINDEHPIEATLEDSAKYCTSEQFDEAFAELQLEQDPLLEEFRQPKIDIVWHLKGLRNESGHILEMAQMTKKPKSSGKGTYIVNKFRELLIFSLVEAKRDKAE